ncbi:hypothetical protein ACIQNG_06295 [Streptomyces sp. NPDC091377]|uniref:hypothetical protein n=1 Tax=Streptomyces sp. NPDC091377 TaxID=3365995 RepID=UPI003811E092
MPTYHEAMTTDLTALTTAAEGWDAMAKEFNKQERAYKRDVHGITLGGPWLGLGQQAAGGRFDVTLKEFQNAQQEAKSIASLLRDAHTQFTRLRGELKDARDGAVEAGMKVTDKGEVSFDMARLDEGARNAYRHDPDYQESVRKAVTSWQNRIDALVKAVTDADKGVEVAFKAVVIDSDPSDGTLNGFNGQAQGDIEVYEAREAEEIANRLKDGDKISDAEMAALQRAFRDNSDDRAFSQTLLTALGTDGTIKLTDRLNEFAHDDDKGRKDQYLQLQGGLADTVAKATQVPGSVTDAPPGSPRFNQWLASDDGRFYRQWTESLEKNGTKNYGSNTSPRYGYQSFAGLMSHADATYDDQFLHEVAGDMIAAEKKQEGLFTEWGAGNKGIRGDGLDVVLGVMSKNPDAATAFFDPAGNGTGADHVKNDHLTYLLNERDWPQRVVTGYGVTEFDDPLSRVGLGAALEAAATGQPPLEDGQDPWPEVPHTDSQARVMHGIIEQLKPSEGTDAPVPDNLRQPLANALAQYTNDTHEILGGEDADYVRALDEGYFREGDSAHLAVSQKDLIQVMRGLSEDPEAYATLHKAESRYIDTQLYGLPEGASASEQEATVRRSGSALGTYTAIREDVINDGRMAEYSEADWKAKVAYHVIGGVVTPMAIPTAGGSIVVGDALQRGVDTWAWQWGNAMKADADASANADVADRYLEANNQMTTMVDTWAGQRGDIDITTREGELRTGELIKAMKDDHHLGSDMAQKYLTDTTN